MNYPLQTDRFGDPTFKDNLFQEFATEPVRASVAWLKRVAILSALCQHVHFFRLEDLEQIVEFFDLGVLKAHYDTALMRYLSAHEIHPDLLLTQIKWPKDENGDILFPNVLSSPCSHEKAETIMRVRRFLAQEMRDRLVLDDIYGFAGFESRAKILLEMVKAQQKMS